MFLLTGLAFGAWPGLAWAAPPRSVSAHGVCFALFPLFSRSFLTKIFSHLWGQGHSDVMPTPTDWEEAHRTSQRVGADELTAFTARLFVASGMH